jgi:hypothetical protein
LGKDRFLCFMEHIIHFLLAIPENGSYVAKVGHICM